MIKMFWNGEMMDGMVLYVLKCGESNRARGETVLEVFKAQELTLTKVGLALADLRSLIG